MRKSPPTPPYSSGTVRPKKPSSPTPGQQRGVDGLVAVPAGAVRDDLVLQEVARQGLERALVLAEAQVHRSSVTKRLLTGFGRS